MAAARLGDDYAFLASTMGAALGQGIGAADPATLEGVLATVPEESFLFATDRLSAALNKTGPGPLSRTGAVPDHGYFGLDPAHLARTDGVVFSREIP